MPDETAEQLWKDPDWRCPSCSYVNFAIRSKCRNCGFDSSLVSGDSYFPVEENDAHESNPTRPLEKDEINS